MSFRAEQSPRGFFHRSADQLYEFLSGHTLQRDIGAKYQYSNLGFGLLGHILELRSGRRYHDLVDERIRRPLSLNSTRVSLTPEMRERVAPGHSEGMEVRNWGLPLAGAGTLRSDAEDMIRFLAANLGLEQTPFLPAMRMMCAPRAPSETGASRSGRERERHAEQGDCV